MIIHSASPITINKNIFHHATLREAPFIKVQPVYTVYHTFEFAYYRDNIQNKANQDGKSYNIYMECLQNSGNFQSLSCTHVLQSNEKNRILSYW